MNTRKMKYRLNPDVCSHTHEGKVPIRQIADLPESQAGAWRHRCAACAFELGYAKGLADAERSRVAASKQEQSTESASPLSVRVVHVHAKAS